MGGGFGPQPGSDDAPKEWPSLVPEPPATSNGAGGPGGGVEHTAGRPTGSSSGAPVEPVDAGADEFAPLGAADAESLAGDNGDA